MDDFRLAIEDSDDQSAHFWPKCAVIYINGVRLYDLARATESDLEKTWVAPPPQVFVAPSRQLLGGPDVWEDAEEPWFDGGAVAVGACSFPGCDALLVNIEIEDDVVVWHSFRRHNGPTGTYAALGPFRFDRTQYEAALDVKP